MLVKIKREQAFSEYPIFPWYVGRTDEFFYPKIYKNYILTLPSKSITQYAKNLSVSFASLASDLGFDSIIFLGDGTNAWLKQENEYKPVKTALNYLKENKVGKRFNGALEIDKTELKNFIPNLFWLTRCNAALPDFHFCDKEQNILGNICKYGNIHIDMMNKNIDGKFVALIRESNFEFLNSFQCIEKFNVSGVIKHRQTIV